MGETKYSLIRSCIFYCMAPMWGIPAVVCKLYRVFYEGRPLQKETALCYTNNRRAADIWDSLGQRLECPGPSRPSRARIRRHSQIPVRIPVALDALPASLHRLGFRKTGKKMWLSTWYFLGRRLMVGYFLCSNCFGRRILPVLFLSFGLFRSFLHLEKFGMMENRFLKKIISNF